MPKDEPFKMTKFKNVESRFKSGDAGSNHPTTILERRNTYEGFKNAAAHSLNIDPNTGQSNRIPKKQNNSTNRA